MAIKKRYVSLPRANSKGSITWYKNRNIPCVGEEVILLLTDSYEYVVAEFEKDGKFHFGDLWVNLESVSYWARFDKPTF